MFLIMKRDTSYNVDFGEGSICRLPLLSVPVIVNIDEWG